MTTGTIREIATGDLVPWTAVENMRVVDRGYAEFATMTVVATLIPGDDTIPQSTEGSQILSVVITPKNTTNRLRFRASAGGAASNTADGLTLAVFRNGVANALAAAYGSLAAYGNDGSFCFVEGEFVPATTSPVTITVRIGGSTGNITLNATPAPGTSGAHGKQS